MLCRFAREALTLLADSLEEKTNEAMAALHLAAQLEPKKNAQYGYVLAIAIALHDSDKVDGACAILDGLLKVQPANRENRNAGQNIRKLLRLLSQKISIGCLTMVKNPVKKPND